MGNLEKERNVIMGDGANLGITAGRALDTVIGGEPQPTEEEQATSEQVRERVMQAPNPCEGKPIHERAIDKDAYSLAADAIAKAFLLAEAEKPGILECELYYSKENTDHDVLWGKPQGAETAVWNYVKEKHPGFDDWIGGASGFMVGFAYNAALYVLGKPPKPNPAIVTVTVSE
jgi:hypothetical protein